MSISAEDFSLLPVLCLTNSVNLILEPNLLDILQKILCLRLSMIMETWLMRKYYRGKKWGRCLPSWSVYLPSNNSKLFTFQASSPKPLGRLEPNLAGMFLGWSSTKLLFFVPVGYSIWLPGPIICSDWLKFQRSSFLKLMNWLNPNCKGMIIGMSFTKFLFFMPIGNPRWPPSQDID